MKLAPFAQIKIWKEKSLMAASLLTLTKHLWLDSGDTARLVKPALMAQLTQQVSASERLHTGEIRLYVEASLPMSYLWRVSKTQPLAKVIRERAWMIFSKLGVWDTAHNNGVLVYVLLAEHAIEIVADRGIAAQVDAAQWASLVADMGQDFREGRIEAGLRRTLERITETLVAHFGVEAVSGVAAGSSKPNELPDAPMIG